MEECSTHPRWRGEGGHWFFSSKKQMWKWRYWLDLLWTVTITLGSISTRRGLFLPCGGWSEHFKFLFQLLFLKGLKVVVAQGPGPLLVIDGRTAFTFIFAITQKTAWHILIFFGLFCWFGTASVRRCCCFIHILILFMIFAPPAQQWRVQQGSDRRERPFCLEQVWPVMYPTVKVCILLTLVLVNYTQPAF